MLHLDLEANGIEAQAGLMSALLRGYAVARWSPSLACKSSQGSPAVFFRYSTDGFDATPGLAKFAHACDQLQPKF